MKREGSGATLIETKSSGAGAVFMKRITPEPCHYCDGSAALAKIVDANNQRRSSCETRSSRVVLKNLTADYFLLRPHRQL